MARKKIVFSDQDLNRLKKLAGIGLSVKQIAYVMGCSERTLERHYQKEMEEGRGEAVQTVAATLFLMATSGKSAAATIFWLKVRARWKQPEFFNELDRQGNSEIKDATIDTNDPIEASRIYQKIMQGD